MLFILCWLLRNRLWLQRKQSGKGSSVPASTGVLQSGDTVFDRLRSSQYFNRAVYGVLSSFVGLLLAVTMQFALATHWGAAQIFLGAAALVNLLLKVDILYVVVAGVTMSILIYFLL